MKRSKNKKGGVYAIRHIATGREYIGSTNRFSKRSWTHVADLKAGRHHSAYLQRAWNKYGEEAFEFVILEVIDDDSLLLEHEQRWLDDSDPAFNMTTCAKAPRRGYKMTEEERAAHTRRMRKAGPKIAETLRGRPGRRLTEEAKRRISQSLMGHEVTPEQIEKQKRSFAEAGYQHSDEVKRKIGEASRRRKRSAATRAKTSASIKAWWAKRKVEGRA